MAFLSDFDFSKHLVDTLKENIWLDLEAKFGKPRSQLIDESDPAVLEYLTEVQNKCFEE